MLLAFGEIMMRVAPPDKLRFRQALPGTMQCTFGGGEANVCASLATFGGKTRYLTALPRHAIADALVDTLRGLDIDTSHILRRESGRLGVYFLEAGANQRGAKVIYDREHSAVSLAGPEEYDFDAALDGVTRLHLTGITPAISENAFRSTLALAQAAKQRGVTVSCDLNYRKKLWQWRPGTDRQTLARECMSEILPSVDLVVANEEDAEKVLGIHAKDTSVDQGRIEPSAYEAVARQVVGLFPNVRQVAITLRESLSASHNNWGAMLFEAAANKTFFAPLDGQGNYCPYEIRDIVDRVGAGDSFAAALIYALDSDDLSDSASAIALAAAASCLKHSIPGDMNYAELEEVRALAAGQTSGRVQR